MEIKNTGESSSLRDTALSIFKGKFIAFYTILVTVIAFFFLYKITFTPADALNEHAGVVVGFLIGTAITTPVVFWFKHGGKPEDEKDSQS
jgi:hypothetical protein